MAVERRTAAQWRVRDPKDTWGEHATNHWLAFQESEQTQQWQPSDWANAWFCCDVIDAADPENSGGRIAASLVRELNVMIASLGVTVGQRNLSKVEMPEKETTDDDRLADQMAEYMKNLGHTRHTPKKHELAIVKDNTDG